ncbi:uncharacterized protein LOC112564363 isoform X1 [Pomacea canaliculata]|uniref:uncharacterized protein LOC112564363 isoform X1 n=1 Tax=Pomacea canaliculata TaxID=400727 RepID=UPI000D73CE9A|nr:uncharacterized protein LOC112564363 isoform X1 [Pomacea canaliculata]
MLPRLILFRGFITPRHGDRKCMEKEEQATEHRQLSCQESSSTTFYPNKVFIRNVAPCVSRELLVSYLENVTGQTHINLLYSDEPGDVLATFTRRIDFEKVKKRCQSKLLNERQLGVWRVPVSNSILVENLSPESDPEHVSCYFETPRANGGTVLEVKPTPDENKFIVVFKDAKTTEGVLKATHRLGGRELRVSLYLECLGPSGGRTEPYIFVPPPPVEVTEADDLKVCFLRHSADILQSFNESLSEVHGQATVEGHVLRVDCTLTGSMYRVDLMAGRWRENVKRQLTICFDSIRLQRIAVHPEIWENVKKAVEESEVSCSDLILTFVEEHSFVVLGRRNTKTVAFEQIQSIIKVKTEECELKKLEVSDTKKVRKHHLELVKSSSFLSDIRTLHTGLTVDISLEHGEITLQGQPMAILDAQVRMYDLIHSFSTKVVTSIPQAQRDLLATEKSHEAVMKKLEANGLTAAWECHSEAIVVYNLNKHWLDPAACIIETSFKSEILFFNKLSSRAFEESQWDSQKKMLVQRLSWTTGISRQKSSIFITSFCDIHACCQRRNQSFYLRKYDLHCCTRTFAKSTEIFGPFLGREDLTYCSEVRAI